MDQTQNRPFKYFTQKEGTRAYTKIKTKHMVNKEWLCPECNFRNYTLAGKHSHLKTKKDQKNANELKN